MPDVELIATKDFSYATRRLRAGDAFTVSAPMAKVLMGINKAQLPREPAAVPPPPPAVIQKAEAVTPPPAPAPAPAPNAVGALTAGTFDHDGDGKPGGSRKGPRRRRAAKKG